MLPGLRFLFAAIVLSTSMLVFGLGAAALLRAAHEELASIPSRRTPPEIMFAPRGQAEPTLALVRIDAPEADRKAATPSASDNVQDQPAIDSVPPEPEQPAAEPDKIAALTDAAMPLENSPSSEASIPDASTSEIPVQAETPAQADAPSPAAETKLAAVAEVTAAPDQAIETAPNQPATPINDSTRIAETSIATLGGPPVIIEPNTPSKIAPAVVKKSVQAKRVVKRRRIAQRARVTQQTLQRPADPFAEPLGAGQRTR
jgi:hypothetical protein